MRYAQSLEAAWARTGLAALAADFGAEALLQDLVRPWLIVATAAAFAYFSEFRFAAGFWRGLHRAVPSPRTGVSIGDIVIIRTAGGQNGGR